MSKCQKTIGSVCLIAGTAIGGGLIALPMVLAPLGIVISSVIMILIWIIAYYSSLINLQLNLLAGKGLSLGELAHHFSGPWVRFLGMVSLKLLCYALLAAYISATVSMATTLIKPLVSQEYHQYLPFILSIGVAVILSAVFLSPIKLVDYLNRLLFFTLIGLLIFLIFSLVLNVQGKYLPLWPSVNLQKLQSWRCAIPVIFTSFGFQVVFHTLTNYCDKDAVILKKSFFWGSLIPTILYIIWTITSLGAVNGVNDGFFQRIVDQQVSIGAFIDYLSTSSNIASINILVWGVSILAIITSAIGVGLGLQDTWKEKLDFVPKTYPRFLPKRVVATVLTVIPSAVIALFIPNAFIKGLGFAGMILVVIALLLPIYLLLKIKIPKSKLVYAILDSKMLIYGCILVGLGIMVLETINLTQ